MHLLQLLEVLELFGASFSGCVPRLLLPLIRSILPLLLSRAPLNIIMGGREVPLIRSILPLLLPRAPLNIIMGGREGDNCGATWRVHCHNAHFAKQELAFFRSLLPRTPLADA